VLTIQHNPTVILSQTREGRHGTGGAKAYLQYVRYIESTVNSAQGAAGDQIKGYGDWLQAPLQPLMDDLGSATYEVFERDPVKYSQYEQAVYLALCDRPQGPV
jgi:protein arginine N-methyltransferase 5